MSDPTPDPDDRLDRGLDALFAAARPGPELEDAILDRLRLVVVRRPFLAGWKARTAAGLAASVGLGVTGFAASRVADGRGLPLPGGDAWVSNGRASQRDEMLGVLSDIRDEKRQSLTNPGVGLEPEVPAAVEVDNLADLNVMKDVVPDQPPGTELWDATKPADTSLYARRSGVAEGRFGAIVVPPMGGPGAARPPAAVNGPVSGNAMNFWYTTDGPALPALATPNPVPATKPVALGVAVVTADPQAAPAAAAEPVVNRKVIRTGEIEFEVDTFDPALATVTKLVAAIPGGFVGTVNSDKLPNGKVKGTVVVRVPPDHLDGFVLDLRRELGKGGELKGQRIASQDVTKQYTDLESRLRAARTMETRLLQIIKEGKGEIKQLLEAEKELGNWRTRIEEFEGELRYYANQVALSTLTVTLTERDLKAAAGITETERVSAGVEVEDVDKAFRSAADAVAEFKGRVTKSELKQLAAGQFTATLHFEVSPESSGPMRDRLNQLGRVSRLQVDRVQSPGAGEVQKGAPVKKGDAVFQVGFYNLANVAPRETAVLRVAVPDVSVAYQALKEAAAKANARVLTSQLNEQDKQNVSAQFDAEVRRTDEAAVLAALTAAGDVLARTASRAPEGDGVTDSKVLLRVTLTSAARLRPRETATLAVEVNDVDATASVFAAQVAEAKGRVADSQVSHDRAGHASAKLSYEVPLAAAAGLVERFKAAGTVRLQQSAKDPQATDGRFATARIDVTLTTADRIVGPDDSVIAQVRKGLAVSASVLLASVTWVVFGLCVVLPWAVVGWAGYRLLRPRKPAAGVPHDPPPAA